MKFVCVHNRNRDNYEVPLALAEAGLLERFVTEFYADPKRSRLLPGLLRGRYREGLPKSSTAISPSSFVIQYAAQALRIRMDKVFPLTDRLLGTKAARIARRQGAGLYCYSAYLNADARLPPGLPIIDFEFHPHPALSLQILEDDFRRFPEVAWSYSLEKATNEKSSISDAWRHAQAVVCASSMTRRSLEFAGCPADRIAVIPYGTDVPARRLSVRRTDKVRFLFVGQGVQRKGLHHLAHAWRQAALADAELTVVSYRMDRGIAALLDQPNVRVLNYQSREALDGLFGESDVFIMPSLVEGFGLVYLEALKAGCHVVGTHNTGLPDLGLSSDAATIVKGGDIDAIASAMISLAERKRGGELDPLAIQAEASKRSWADFRRAIAAHARSLESA